MLTKDELMYYKQSHYIECMDNDGYWYDNPRELIYGIEIDDMVNKKIVRRIASLLIKLSPTGERTKDKLSILCSSIPTCKRISRN